MKRVVETKKVCVVTMYRWGLRDGHSYVLGVFTTKTKAKKAAEKEWESRGGNKYFPNVLEIQLDSSNCEEHKEIIKLDDPHGLKKELRMRAERERFGNIQ